jgi:DNA modification methylase
VLAQHIVHEAQKAIATIEACTAETLITGINPVQNPLSSPDTALCEAFAVRYQLICGDNLEVLRRHDIPDESVDLVYLDPPFNSDKNYNLLFKRRNGALAVAFKDTWQWGPEAQRDLEEVKAAGGDLAKAMSLYEVLLDGTDMLAYLAMMAPRLMELHRVLRPSGSLYLHCDPTASHYLKTLLDAIFGGQNFKNEIIWKRTSAHSSAKKYGPVHDVILFYGKSDSMFWKGGHLDYDPSYIEQRFRTDEERPWKDADLTGAGITKGESGKPWRGFDPAAKGRHWAYVPSELDRLDKEGKIYWPKKEGGWPRLKKYLDEAKGIPLQDVWVDIFPVNSQAEERLGYPTQKPETLLQRIIKASTTAGDTVLDPFCGCGTTIEVSHREGRRWIGIDISKDAIDVIRDDRIGKFGNDFKYEMIWRPRDMDAARAFAAEQPFQFQDWAVEKLGGAPTKRRAGDRGVDGKCYFKDDLSGPVNHPTRQIIISVKGGKIKPAFVRELQGAVDGQRAVMGVLLTLNEPSKQMISDAAKYSFYHCSQGSFPRIQIITVKNILDGERLKLPQLINVEAAKKATSAAAEQRALFETG